MSQEPHININPQESSLETTLPVPRRMPSRPAENINPDFVIISSETHKHYKHLFFL